MRMDWVQKGSKVVGMQNVQSSSVAWTGLRWMKLGGG